MWRMTGAPPAPLAHECDVFSRYLLGMPASSYVEAAYGRAVAALGLDEARTGDHRLEAVLLRIARSRPTGTRLADACSLLFHPESQVRRRLVLLLAIHESTPFARDALGKRRHGTPWRSIGQLCPRVVSSLCFTVAALPLGLVLRLRTPREGRGEAT